MSVCAIVHATFEAREGYKLEKAFPNNVNFKGIEYSLFPSGIQQLNQCMVAFRFRDQLCLSIYRKKLGKDYERNAYFSSIGILLQDAGISVEEAAVKYLKLLDFVSKAIVSSDPTKEPNNINESVYQSFQKTIESLYDASEPLEEYQQRLQLAVMEQNFSAIISVLNNREKITYNSFSLNLAQHYYSLIDKWLGPTFLLLYKCMMQKKRILLVSLPNPEIYAIMDAMTRLSSVFDEEHGVLPNPLCKFYSVGLTDIDFLENSNPESGWIVSTADSILLSKSSLYDVAFIWPANPLSKSGPPRIQLSNSLSLKYSYEDALNLHLISERFDPRIAGTSKFTKYSVGAIIHIILFNSTRFHLVQSLVSTNQRNLFSAFPRYNQFLLSRLNQDHDKISIADMRNFGCNPFRQLDRDFVFNVAQIWLHKYVHYRYPSYAYLMQPIAWGIHSLLLSIGIWKRSVPTLLIYLLLLKWWYS
ncbi:uncharacterized protein SOCG_04419 [Schizosaccharomyces octosporus yFS286]|uniref:Fungal protein n=1 Tax=Schizosaccharomyces octosporus (strain yFS286) TaxID=483514 RepID=S9RML5_SCHOY|nr:uncharacterized protein SOCG_04419 [Schizosaccharomyces octosporus yFS286]EPX75174.1 fungal protein [Schizosaccharomyces octosporus yFS286]